MVPGSRLTLYSNSCKLEQSMPEDQVKAIFSDKRAYLTEYQASKRPLIQAAKGQLAGR